MADFTLHVSCSSDKESNYMAGMVIFSYQGKTDFYLNNHHIKKGYILIKQTCNIQHVNCNVGQVHGKLFKWMFAMEPLGCTDVNGYGFAIVDGIWKFKSWTLNDRVTDGIVPSDIRNSIKAAVENYWRTGQQNYRPTGNISIPAK